MRIGQCRRGEVSSTADDRQPRLSDAQTDAFQEAIIYSSGYVRSSAEVEVARQPARPGLACCGVGQCNAPQKSGKISPWRSSHRIARVYRVLTKLIHSVSSARLPAASAGIKQRRVPVRASGDQVGNHSRCNRSFSSRRCAVDSERQSQVRSQRKARDGSI